MLNLKVDKAAIDLDISPRANTKKGSDGNNSLILQVGNLCFSTFYEVIKIVSGRHSTALSGKKLNKNVLGLSEKSRFYHPAVVEITVEYAHQGLEVTDEDFDFIFPKIKVFDGKSELPDLVCVNEPGRAVAQAIDHDNLFGRTYKRVILILEHPITIPPIIRVIKRKHLASREYKEIFSQELLLADERRKHNRNARGVVDSASADAVVVGEGNSFGVLFVAHQNIGRAVRSAFDLYPATNLLGR